MTFLPLTPNPSPPSHIPSSRPPTLARATAGLVALYTTLAANSSSTTTTTTTSTTQQVPIQQKQHEHYERTLGDRFTILKIIDGGAFSTVYKCRDNMKTSKEHQICAVKVMATGNHQIGIEEANHLKAFYKHDNAYTAMHLPKLITTFTDHGRFCLAMEYCAGGTLKTRQPIPFTDRQQLMKSLKKITIQILKALMLFDEIGIIHADLKPENILFLNDTSNKIKIADFGNTIHEDSAFMNYDNFEIQSLLYRAPEVLMGLPFTSKIDIWSLGLIIAELYMQCSFIDVIPKSPIDVVKSIQRILGPFPKERFSQGKYWVPEYNYGVGRGLNKVLYHPTLDPPTAPPDFIRFVSRLLTLDPEERVSAAEALLDPWLTDLYPHQRINDNLEELRDIQKLRSLMSERKKRKVSSM